MLKTIKNKLNLTNNYTIYKHAKTLQIVGKSIGYFRRRKNVEK